MPWDCALWICILFLFITNDRVLCSGADEEKTSPRIFGQGGGPSRFAELNLRNISTKSVERVEPTINQSNGEDLFSFTQSNSPRDSEHKNRTTSPEAGNFSNGNALCGYHHSDKSCPIPSPDEIVRITSVCSAIELQMKTTLSLSLIFGLPGSALVLITVSNMVVNSATVYLGCLAASDIASLLYGIYISNRLPQYGSPTYSDFAGMWFGRVFQTFAHWTLALMCLERFISVKLPLLKSWIFTIKNTGLSASAAFFLSAVPFIWGCVHYSIENYNGYIALPISVLHNLIYSFIPGTFIVIFSALTAVYLRKFAERRQTMMTSRSAERSSKMEADLTRMTLVTSISFVVFLSPCVAMHIFDGVRGPYCPLEEAEFLFVLYACFSFSFLNHSINFYVYYVCARGFRNQLWRVICKKRKGENNEVRM